MLHESGKHLETPTVKLATFVLEKKTESTVLNGKAQLPLPNSTGLLIVHVGDEGLICVVRLKFGHTQIKLDLFQ